MPRRARDAKLAWNGAIAQLGRRRPTSRPARGTPSARRAACAGTSRSTRR